MPYQISFAENHGSSNINISQKIQNKGGIKYELWRKAGFIVLVLTVITGLVTFLTPNSIFSQWVVFIVTLALLMFLLVFLISGWKYIISYYTEEKVDYLSTRFITPKTFPRLIEKAHHSGLNNQPLPKSLICLIRSEIGSQHQVFLQHYEEARPKLTRQKDILLSSCSAHYELSGDLAGFHSAPVTFHEVYQSIQEKAANDNGGMRS